MLRFEVSAETLAHVRDAFAVMRSRSEGRLDDDAVLLLMAREVLAGPMDDGRASYQVAITTCEQCRRGFQQAAGAPIEVEAEILEMACCDAQQIGRLDPPRKVVGQSTHMGHGPRATQEIPPALRRKVMRRDHGRCVVPGCRHHRFVDLHHLRARSDGGEHDENNLVVLCSAHHRAVHRGELWPDGSLATGLSFRHADGATYGANPSPWAADQNARAFRGLRSLGFSERAVARALERARADLADEQHNVERLMRAALSVLVPGATPPARASAS